MYKSQDILKEIMEETKHNVKYFVRHNIKHIGTAIEIAIPYLMYVIGSKMTIERGMFTIGGEVFLPVCLWLVANFIKSVANKINRGPRIPKPVQRFTEVDEDGIVSIEQDRLDELLVYMSDLEDWMERKGWL